MMLLGSGQVELFHLTPPDALWLWASEGDKSTAIAATEASETGNDIMVRDTMGEETVTKEEKKSLSPLVGW